MTGLAADVASLATSLGTVASNVTRLVAIIAALHGKATGIVATLRATARHVTSLVAIVTTQFWPLLAVFRNVPDTIAAVAKILILFAFARKVSELVALEAFFSPTAETTIPVTATISSTSTSTSLWALPRKVAHAVTFVTCT